jgi:hypothetical protein
MIDALRDFARFCYNFLVGDDWRVALGVAVALAITIAVSHTTHSRGGGSWRPPWQGYCH